jgi:hypothetical protein
MASPGHGGARKCIGFLLLIYCGDVPSGAAAVIITGQSSSFLSEFPSQNSDFSEAGVIPFLNSLNAPHPVS